MMQGMQRLLAVMTTSRLRSQSEAIHTSSPSEVLVRAVPASYESPKSLPCFAHACVEV
jgi:hypothetical protein